MRFFLILVSLSLGSFCAAEPLRVAVYTVELDRTGPGRLLRDILKREDQVVAVAKVIAQTNPDILLLLRFDYDLQGVALRAFADVIAEQGVDYPETFALRPNSGLATDLDLDGDGRLRGPGDAQGYGSYAGQYGMAVLSKYPLDQARARDFSGLLWRELPGAHLPRSDGRAFPSTEAQEVQRLASVAFWDLPVQLGPETWLHLLTFHAAPPVFDGPEDRNGLRNRDELRFWPLYLDGALTDAPADAPVIVLGNSNLDPAKGEGRRAAIADLLAHPRLQDPAPQSDGAAMAGDRLDTVLWQAPGEPGNMRVDYVLPDARLTVSGAGVFWPDATDPLHGLLGETGVETSRHRLVWVDLDCADCLRP